MKAHWREYGTEALLLGLFMFVACAVGVLLLPEASLGRRLVPDDTLRRGIFGVAMGLTAIAIIYSPLGRISGAHINPATTLAFLRLGRISPHDAAFYVLFQAIGAVLGVGLARLVVGPAVASSEVLFVATTPGPVGALWALLAEMAMGFSLLSMVLWLNGAPYTGICVGIFVACMILLEAPISGMSLNPARSLGSNLFAGRLDVMWLYAVGPTAGMVAAASVFPTLERVHCAVKMHHDPRYPCIFCDHLARKENV